jgi:hypothetical protein
MVVMASLVGYAQAYGYYCYSNWSSKSGYAGNHWYYIYAWAYGCFYVPSDGNLYETSGGGGGSTSAPRAVTFNFVYPEENGCAGDAFYSITYIIIDADGDGYLDHWDYVTAAVKAPPCGAI